MDAEPAADISIDTGPEAGTVRLSGSLTIRTVSAARAALSRQEVSRISAFDLSRLARLDTAGAWLLVTNGAREGADIRGATPEMSSIIDSVARAMPRPEPVARHRATLSDLLDATGRRVVSGTDTFLGLTAYLGLFLSRLARTLAHPREFRLTSLVHHCEEVGVKAVPIVALMSFLIGVVLAFQGASQLRQFGAEVFVVDLIAVSILRELGILLTAIIVAGRTASAFTAAIGSMKMREEIDAMRTLGLDPATVLFVPRILALLMMLPILGLIANVSGLVGGALMSWIELGISPELFRTRLIDNTDLSHLVVGLVKAPFFALIIGVVGCHAGMQVGNNAESLGQQTSKAVVAAIFAVIVADALFSVFFAEIGL